MPAMFTPSQVEEQLRMLQRELSPAEARSSLFNLVIFSRSGLAAPIDRALSYLLGKRAARIIQIVEARENESSMSVTARCYPDRENKGVCFQEVMIENGADDAGTALGTWTPLLVRDIPTFVLWYDRASERRQFLSGLRDFADKLIIDSEWLETNGESPDTLFSIIAEDFVHTGSLVSDLNWRRTLSLRLMTAYLFDNDTTIELLDSVSSIEVSGTELAASELYFLWLASRLGWNWEGKFTFRNGIWTARNRSGKDILLKRLPGGAPGSASKSSASKGSTPKGSAAKGAAGSETAAGPASSAGTTGSPSGGANPISVRLEAAGGKVLTISAEPGGRAEVSAPGLEAAHYHFRVPGDGEMLMEEVDALRSDYLFGDAMRRLRDSE